MKVEIRMWFNEKWSFLAYSVLCYLLSFIIIISTYGDVNKCFRCFEQFKLLHELCDNDEAAYIVSTLNMRSCRLYFVQ